MSKNKELELMLETYRGLITDDEQITARISHQDRKREKLQRQQAKIYEDMAAVEERIRELLGSPDADELPPQRQEAGPEKESGTDGRRSGQLREAGGRIDGRKMMFEKSLGMKIDEAIKAGKSPDVIIPMMAEATGFFGAKLSDAFVHINEEDAPYIIAAMDCFREILVKALDPDGQGLEEAARQVKSLMKVDAHIVKSSMPMTETAARELAKAFRESKYGRK